MDVTFEDVGWGESSARDKTEEQFVQEYLSKGIYDKYQDEDRVQMLKTVYSILKTEAG